MTGSQRELSSFPNARRMLHARGAKAIRQSLLTGDLCWCISQSKVEWLYALTLGRRADEAHPSGGNRRLHKASQVAS